MGCTERWSMLISIIFFFSSEQTLIVLNSHPNPGLAFFFCMGKRR